ncbi:peptidyl-prolyl cis-trans isomerase [Striga asiatica]|uniref:peptidylprolyl isomerase n=1 Tax=Striga asiatica TaxID=4170 RepID=A0A5A7P952_STRAF|nr:peptidyl-prolyl cis-trans isomerase [Striga asiatica]
MASLGILQKFLPSGNPRTCSKPSTRKAQSRVFEPLPVSRRSVILISVVPLSLAALPQTLLARERRNRKIIPLEDYLTSPTFLILDIFFANYRFTRTGVDWISYEVDGLKYYDLVEGKGPVAEKGSTVQVHFDCIYRGITAVSSRESKLLAGNRIIAQPYEFQVGAVPGKERKRDFVDNPNGLFSAQAAPKPPKAMYTITEGMKRTVIIPPEAGYGPKGMNEIPFIEDAIQVQYYFAIQFHMKLIHECPSVPVRDPLRPDRFENDWYVERDNRNSYHLLEEWDGHRHDQTNVGTTVAARKIRHRLGVATRGGRHLCSQC